MTALVDRLTPELREEIARGARNELARRSLFHFFRFGWHVLEPETPLEPNWHHRMVCDYIQAMLEGWIKRKRDGYHQLRVQNAIINMPPGTTKSRIISVFANAWMWLHWPSWTVLCLSGNPDVAERDAINARDIIASEWYRTSFRVTWTIRDDIDAKKKFKNSMGGERTSRGMLSKIVGNRTDCILIDDPNDMYEVMSEASRREVNRKFNDQIYSRVNDVRFSLRIMMQQRGHVQDLTGFWEGKGNVERMSVPMEYDPELAMPLPFGLEDPRKEKGELLHPLRFTPEFVAAERLRLGPFMFEAQYNQNPKPLDGGMFKRGRWGVAQIENDTRWVGRARPDGVPAYGMMLPTLIGWRKDGRLDVDSVLISVDATFGSDSDSASRVGLLAIALKGSQRIILEDRTSVMSFPQTLRSISALRSDVIERYKMKDIRTLVEKKANGAAIIQTLGREVTGFIAVDPEGGKVARAHAMLPAHEAGNWMLMDGAPWAHDLVSEWALFGPGCEYDDRVDAASQVEIYVGENMGAAQRWRALVK